MSDTVEAKAQGPADEERKLEAKVAEIRDSLSEDFLYWTLKKAVKEEILSPAYSSDNLERDVMRWMEHTGLATKLRNEVYLHEREKKRGERTLVKGPLPPVPTLEEPLEMVEAAKKQWDTRLRYELRAVATKQKRKLAQPRELSDGKESHVDDNIRFVYTAEDLLDTLVAVTNPNLADAASSKLLSWGVIKLFLKTSSLAQLRKKYVELRPDSRQVGVDDTVLGLEWFRHERLNTGNHLLSEAYIPAMRQYAKTGVPPSLRPRMWSKILGVTAEAKDQAYFESLLAHVQRWDLVTDDLTRYDVQDVSDHDEYFVFEEVMDEIMLAFTRDSEVPSLCSIPVNSAVLRAEGGGAPGKSPSWEADGAGGAASKGGRAVGPTDAVPPNEIVPFHRQAMFAAPICFLFANSDGAYFLFRALYCRYWCRLHVVSSQPDTILYLSQMFESLLQARHPEVFHHSLSLGVPPLTIAFPWIFSGFAGWLDVDQVLLLWDRLIAYDSLELLPIAAASIFLFRARNVAAARSAEEVQDIFREMSNLKIIPLLQHFLFSNTS